VVPDVSNATQVVAGYRHSCALLTDKTVTCWGAGGPPFGAAAAVSDLTDVEKLVSPWIDVTCALRSDNTVWCWGGWADIRYPRSSLTGATDIAGTPYSHLCGLMPDGSIRCLSDPWSTKYIDVLGAQMLSVGALGGCAVIGDGVKCWGMNSEGFLGNDTIEPPGAIVGPTDVLGVDSVASLVSGQYHSCVVLTSGSAKCWGANHYGQIGAGILAPESTPSPPASKFRTASSTSTALVDVSTMSLTDEMRLDGIGVASKPQKVVFIEVTPPPGYRPSPGSTTTTTTTTTTSSTTTTSTTAAVSSSTLPASSSTNPTSSTTNPGSSTTSGTSSSTTPTSSSTTVAPGPMATATPGNRTAKLTWRGDEWPTLGSITSFQVQRSADGGRTWRPVQTLARTKRSHTVLLLTNGTRYRLRIRALHNKTAGSWVESNDVTPRTVPSQPRSIRVTGGNGTLSVTWLRPLSTGGAAITEYRLQLSLNGRTWTTAASIVPVLGSTQSTVLTGLSNGVKRFVRVVAVNAAGSSRAITSRKVAPVAPK
jgi:hypothetical protein